MANPSINAKPIAQDLLKFPTGSKDLDGITDGSLSQGHATPGCGDKTLLAIEFFVRGVTAAI
jgi:hypothetical protein